MKLPINTNQLLHSKAAEWERLEFKTDLTPQVKKLFFILDEEIK